MNANLYDIPSKEERNRIFAIWARLTGFVPEKSEGIRRISIGMYPTLKKNESIERMLRFDPYGIFALTLLRGAYESWITQTRHVSFFLSPEGRQFIADATVIKNFFSSSEYIAAESLAKEQIKKILSPWNTEDILDVIGDAQRIEQACGALSSLRMIRIPLNMPVKQVISEKLRCALTLQRFATTADFLSVMVSTPGALRMGFVFDPETRATPFFIMGLASGNHVYALTDQIKERFPGQETVFQSRSGGWRNLQEQRMDNTIFPYDLLSGGSGIHSCLVSKEMLQAGHLAALRDIPRSSLLVLLSLASLFWQGIRAGDYDEKPLHFIPAQVANALTTNNSMPSFVACSSFKLPLLAAETVLTEPQGITSHRNDCLENFYREEAHTALFASGKSDLPALLNGEENSLALAIGENTFLTPQEIQDGQHYVARKRYANWLGERVQEDYANNYEQVALWYKKRCLNQVAALTAMIVDTFADSEFESNKLVRVINGVEIHFYTPAAQIRYTNCTNGKIHHQGGINGVSFYHTERVKKEQQVICPYGNVMWYFALLRPQSIEGIQTLAGTTFSRLPHWLQAWAPHQEYVGNSMLDKVDPVEMLRNPWAESPFLQISMAVSLPIWGQIKEEGAETFLKEKRQLDPLFLLYYKDGIRRKEDAIRQKKNHIKQETILASECIMLGKKEKEHEQSFRRITHPGT